MANFEFGAFKNGTIGAEIADTSWNWSTGSTGSPSHPKVQIIAGPAGTVDPDNGTNNAVRLIADDSMTFSGQGALARIHGIDRVGGAASFTWWGIGKEQWRVVAIRIPSGANFTNNTKTTTEEIHGPNGCGPVNNICNFQRGGGFWRHYIRGNNTVNGAYAFQWIFGPDDGSGVTGSNNHQDWANGNKVVTEDEWVVFLYGILQSSSGTGWFEAYHANPGASAFTTDVPRKTGIYTAFPSVQTPYMSCYYATGAGAQQAVDYCGGKWFSNYAEALAYAQARFNIGAGGTGVANTARPTVTGTNEQGQTLTGHAGTWTGAPTLAYQWEWDQGTGTWVSVTGATALTFVESATFVGAQVRLRETANGTINAYSDPITVNVVGGGTSGGATTEIVLGQAPNAVSSSVAGTVIAQTIGAVAAGDTILALVQWQSTVATCAVTDNIGNTYTPLGSAHSDGVYSSQWFKVLASAAGTPTITATISASVTYRALKIGTFQNVASVEGTPAESFGNATTATAPAVTPALATDAVVSYCAPGDSVTAITAPFTQLGDIATGMAISYRLDAGTGAQTPTFTKNGSGNYWAGSAVLVAKTAGGGVPGGGTPSSSRDRGLNQHSSRDVVYTAALNRGYSPWVAAAIATRIPLDPRG